MLRIGYVREVDAASQQDSALLEAAGCQVVRHEATRSEGVVLDSILEFIGPGDLLVVQRLDRLAGSGRGLLRVLDALEARGAGLQVLTPCLASQGAAGRALRAAVEAVASLEPPHPVRGHRAAAIDAIVALRNQGLGPVEIARRLGVSRMTVWRRLQNLKSMEA
ncbi:recombinase family protein [Phenylobacterium sp.]|jgi:DNA invertase Pin-like site-specific DNA recombinase|uniref:recombinase family protein n=1 Tax=Phenylobacterium sp. TaxID=1871053 RepID=UPI0037C65643